MQSMAVSNRATKLNKLHKVAKKQFEPVTPPSDRSVMEHLMYACCLEDSKFESADEAFARLQQNYFDWNEVRVTTAVELSESMKCLSEPIVAANRLKKTLHSMFEAHYAFDIDSLKKENLGKAVQKIEKYNGITPFVVAYVAQNGLGGHSIGVDKSLINLMYAIGVITEKEAEKGQVPGLERAVPKNKGVEFFSLVHQLAVLYTRSPFNTETRKTILSIDASAQERFPKRTRKKAAPPKAVKKTEPEPTVNSTKKSSKKTTTKKEAKSTTTKKRPVKKVAKKAAKKATRKATAKKTTKKKPAKRSKSKTKKSPTKRLARKKPR